ncbi:MAG TPA: hypothetical protein V6D28_02985 [Leptolyngbyaceae cyanobacterium]
MKLVGYFCRAALGKEEPIFICDEDDRKYLQSMLVALTPAYINLSASGVSFSLLFSSCEQPIGENFTKRSTNST